MASWLVEEAKEFGELNFSMPNYSQLTVDCERYDVAVSNPWIDQSGRFPLTDEEAVREWGLDVVVDFCEKVRTALTYDPHRIEQMRKVVEDYEGK